MGVHLIIAIQKKWSSFGPFTGGILFSFLVVMVAWPFIAKRRAIGREVAAWKGLAPVGPARLA